MPKVTLPVSNGFYVSESLPVSAQECINWYPNIPQAPALTEGNLFATPGIALMTASSVFAEGINRGSIVKNDLPYFVNGNTLFLLERTIGNPDTFEMLSLGTIEGSGRVSLAENGTQICILVPGGKGYIYNEADATPFQEIVDPDFTANGAPQHVVFLDGFFVFTTDQKKFIISALNDGLSYNALDFGSVEADPDKVVAPHVHSNTLFIGGGETFESFQNIGGSGFPFQRISGGVFDKGLFAPFSIIETNSAFYFIGGGLNESPAIWRSTGSTPEKISTTAIDNVLDGFDDVQIADAFAWQYAAKGAYFVGFSIGSTTFVYDATAQRWHERRSLFRGILVRWRVNSLVTAYSRIIVGDGADGRIGELSSDVFKEYGLTIFRRFACQPLSQQSARFSLASIELVIESGTANDDDPDPQIRMDLSKDGKKFENERSRSMGKVGEFNRRPIWYKNGSFPRMGVIRFTTSAPVVQTVISLEVDVA